MQREKQSETNHRSGKSILRRRSGLFLLAIAALVSVNAARGDFLVSPASGLPAGGPYEPPGTLYDNGQSNGVRAIGSQNGDNDFTSRAADEFSLPSAPCPAGQFDISTVRMQLVQTNPNPQPFHLEIYEDDGTDASPNPPDAISPIASFPETTQVSLGIYDTGLTLFEVTFDTQGLTLLGDKVYWISGFGTNNTLNAFGFENFVASSDGAAGTSPNGVFINPDRLADFWTPVHLLAGGPPLFFSFAIDGSCQEEIFSDGFEDGSTDAWSAVVP